MSSIALNLDPMLCGAAIALAVALFGTPRAWRAAAGLSRVPRAVLANLACIGVAGLAALPIGFSALRLEGTALAAIAFAAALQGVALILLLLIPTKA